jgi:hypothetical protein
MNVERTIYYVALWATPLILLATGFVGLPRDPLWAGVTFWCSGCTFGMMFAMWSRSRR